MAERQLWWWLILVTFRAIRIFLNKNGFFCVVWFHNARSGTVSTHTLPNIAALFQDSNWLCTCYLAPFITQMSTLRRCTDSTFCGNLRNTGVSRLPSLWTTRRGPIRDDDLRSHQTPVRRKLRKKFITLPKSETEILEILIYLYTLSGGIMTVHREPTAMASNLNGAPWESSLPRCRAGSEKN